jgi:hypothetical protein
MISVPAALRPMIPNGSPRVAALGLRFLLIVSMTRVACTAVAQQTEVLTKPSLDEVTRFTQQFFEKQPGFQPGDLVTRGATMRLITALREKGWQVADQQELLERVLKDDDFLVRQFRDERGREFLRKIEKLPEGIDRVDRLSKLPQGELSVNDLIRKVPNGAEWIEAMTTTRRGEILGERLSNAPAGRDFNEPTGRLYNVDALAKAIHERLEPASLNAKDQKSPK